MHSVWKRDLWFEMNKRQSPVLEGRKPVEHVARTLLCFSGELSSISRRTDHEITHDPSDERPIELLGAHLPRSTHTCDTCLHAIAAIKTPCTWSLPVSNLNALNLLS